MSSELTLQDKLLAPLTFNKERLSIIGNTDSDSGLALGIILVNSLLGGLLAYVDEDAGFASFIDADNAAQYFLVGFMFQLLILLIFAWIQGFVVRGFGGQCSTAAALRMLGFASVWSIVGTLLGFVGLSSIAGFIGLIAFLCFAFGLSALSGLGIISAIIAVILAYILAVILVLVILLIVLVVIIFAIFG